MTRARKAWWIVALVSAWSCERTPQSAPPPDSPSNGYAGAGFFICNEGNFRWSNASLAFYSETEDTVYQEIFRQANNRPLGDVAQSMTIIDGKGYVVVNNSGKVEVINPLTAQSEKTIDGLMSPRYIVPTGDGRAYVSDLYAQAITVIDLASHQIVDTISYPDWTEYWVVTPSGIVGCGVKRGKVFIIDPATDQIIQEQTLRPEISGMVTDRQGHLWVLCNGGFEQMLPALYKLRIPNLTPIDSFVFRRIKDHPGNLTITPAGDSLFFSNYHIYAMDIADTKLPDAPYFEVTNRRTIYHLSCHPRKPWLIATDAIDYVQEGKVLILSRTPTGGQLIDSLQVGIIPGHITFVP